jgi:hypothetical protein
MNAVLSSDYEQSSLRDDEGVYNVLFPLLTHEHQHITLRYMAVYLKRIQSVTTIKCSHMHKQN